ncbi:Canalicular multispecific organic anion transporter 1, variant 2, partial [Bonamia ostreae]
MLNRFSSDTSTLDRSIPRSSFSFLTCFAEVVAILIIISVITPFFIVGLIPLCVMYYFIQTFFIRPTRDIKRIGSTLLSPVYSGFQETLDGTTTIRAFKEEKRFERENNEKLDRFTRVFFSNFIANRWLQVRLELLGSFVVALSSILIVVSRNKLSGGLAGLTLTYALRFVATLNWMFSFKTRKNVQNLQK